VPVQATISSPSQASADGQASKRPPASGAQPLIGGASVRGQQAADPGPGEEGARAAAAASNWWLVPPRARLSARAPGWPLFPTDRGGGRAGWCGDGTAVAMQQTSPIINPLPLAFAFARWPEPSGRPLGRVWPVCWAQQFNLFICRMIAPRMWRKTGRSFARSVKKRASTFCPTFSLKQQQQQQPRRRRRPLARAPLWPVAGGGERRHCCECEQASERAKGREAAREAGSLLIA